MPKLLSFSLNVLKKLGLLRAVILFSTFCILFSVGIAYLATLLAGKKLDSLGLIISIFIPGVLTIFLSLFVVPIIYQLDSIKEQLQILSITDDLTGAYNRRHFIDLTRKEWLRAKRYGDEFGVILFDIDDFKSINDSHGHAAGDKVLCEVASTCTRIIRASDTFARYGGDEFVFLIPNAGESQLQMFMERVRSALAEMVVHYKKQKIQITISIGGKHIKNENVEFEDILIQSDEALYKAKRKGGNTSNLAGT